MKTFKPYPYQAHAYGHALQNPRSMLVLGMGLGKTAICSMLIDELVYNSFETRKVLIIAPLAVANLTWPNEFRKWANFAHFGFELLTGGAKARTKALLSPAPIHIINRENIVWLVKTLNGRWPYDLLIIDEISSFKSREAQRWHALFAAYPAFKRVVGLTGTPAPNGLIDLWPQVALLDGGQRLGRNITAYRERWFIYDQARHRFYPKPGAEDEIYKALGDIVISMKAEDYLTMPPLTVVDYPVALPPDKLGAYKKFERDTVLQLFEHDKTITAANAAALMSKLLQYSAGAVYENVVAGAQPSYSVVHDAKLDALSDIVEAAGGDNVLVFYDYRHTLERIRKRYPKARLVTEKGAYDDWNAGKIKLLLAHPASAGHGLNLQDGGHIAVYIMPPWSLELYQQSVARLYRQGQTKPVTVYRLLAEGTRDGLVVSKLEGKAAVQDSFLESVKVILSEYFSK